MPRYKCHAIERRYIAGEIEASSVDEARSLFKIDHEDIELDDVMVEIEDRTFDLDTIEVVE